MKITLKQSWMGLLFLAVGVTAGAQDITYVELNDGTRIYGSVELRDPFFKTTKLIVNDTTAYSLSEVKAYRDENGYFRRLNNSESRFAQRIERGKISLFARTVTRHSAGWMPGPNGTSIYMGGGPSTRSVEYFSKDGGPLLKANARNLKSALADNSVSMSYLKKRDGLTALQVIGAVAGATIGVLSVTSQADSDELNPTGLIVGAAVLSGSIWLPHFGKRNLNQKAIRAYNHAEEF